MLKIDMHVHTWYSDSKGSVDEVLEVAEAKELDGLAITDHHTLQGAQEAIKKAKRLLIIPGEEVKTVQGEVLALGIKSLIPKNLPVMEALRRIHAQGGLAVVPHPTVPFFSGFKESDLRSLPIDGLEAFSAITPMAEHYFRKNLELSRRLGLSITAGSDSHFPETVGDAYTIVCCERRTVNEVLRAIKSGHTKVGGGSSSWSFKLRMVLGMFSHMFSNSCDS